MYTTFTHEYCLTPPIFRNEPFTAVTQILYILLALYNATNALNYTKTRLCTIGRHYSSERILS
jgi:hypothetical protein